MSQIPQDGPHAGQPPASDGAPRELRKMQERLRPLRGVPVEVSIELGQGKLKLRDLLGLRYHSVFELNKTAGADLDLYVNGLLLARVEPVIQEDRVGIKINEIVDL